MAESGCAAAPPLVHVDPDNPDDTPPPPPLPPRPRARFNSVAVRLSNNRLRSLDGLREFLQHVLDSPEQLAWLDVSCNELERVDTVLQDYPNLQVRVATRLCVTFNLTTGTHMFERTCVATHTALSMCVVWIWQRMVPECPASATTRYRLLGPVWGQFLSACLIRLAAWCTMVCMPVLSIDLATSSHAPCTCGVSE